MKPWNSLWLFLKLTLSNHLRNCIKNIVNKNNSTWEVECKIGKVSLQDGQNLKETGIISGLWVIFLKFSWQILFDKPEGRWLPWVWYSTLPEEHTILNSTEKKEKINLKTKCYTFHTIIRLQKEPFDTKDFNWGKTVWKTRLS